MKKHILLTLMAFFAATVLVFGQGALPGTAPRPIENCESGPLNPIAGVPYDYSAELDPSGGTAYWFATFNNTSFISNGILTTDQEDDTGDFIVSATNYQNSTPGAAAISTTTITWDAVGLAQVDNSNPLFLAINYTASTDACANNLKVYRINPINAFLVNILNIDGLDYGDEVETCFSDIQSAEYNMLTSLMEYDFGQNILAYEVVAANFTEFYNLSFRIEGLQPDQNANIYWNYSNNFATATVIDNGPYGNEIVSGPTIQTFEPSTGNGVSVFVWLEVNNNNFEGLDDTPITLAVAGVNSANQPNVRWNDCGIPVDLAVAFNDPDAPDHAIHTLLARPTVLPAGDLNFENQVEP